MRRRPDAFLRLRGVGVVESPTPTTPATTTRAFFLRVVVGGFGSVPVGVVGVFDVDDVHCVTFVNIRRRDAEHGEILRQRVLFVRVTARRLRETCLAFVIFLQLRRGQSRGRIDPIAAGRVFRRAARSRAREKSNDERSFLLNLTLARRRRRTRGRHDRLGVSRPDVVAITDNRRASASASTSADVARAVHAGQRHRDFQPSDGTVAFVHGAALRVRPSRRRSGLHLERCHTGVRRSQKQANAGAAQGPRSSRPPRDFLWRRQARHDDESEKLARAAKNVLVRRIAPNNDVSLETT